MAGRTFSLRMFLPAVAAALVLVAGACDKKKDDYVERPVEELYNDALGALERGNYEGAAKAFDEVERQHPYSAWATKAQLMAAYANYERSKYDDAIVGLDRFIQLHPSNKDIPYAYYLKALCYYEQISDVARDQKITDLARKTLRELITRYPQSKYSRDAKLKYDLTEDHLAGKEMDIGRHYLRTKHYLAAINRFKVVTERFQTTTHVPEALHRLAEAYVALGLTQDAERVTAVLGHNYPGSDWYLDAYEMVTGKRVRTAEEAAWYKVWHRPDEPDVKPLRGEGSPAGKRAGRPPAEGDREETQPADSAPPGNAPWWKVW
ncbi:MAG: outer membrane protein assembly factor BamD [Magnetospirillum sp. WYHS-4]